MAALLDVPHVLLFHGCGACAVVLIGLHWMSKTPPARATVAEKRAKPHRGKLVRERSAINASIMQFPATPISFQSLSPSSTCISWCEMARSSLGAAGRPLLTRWLR